MFIRTRGVWTDEAKLLPDDGEEDDSFGTSIALDGDRRREQAPFGRGVHLHPYGGHLDQAR